MTHITATPRAAIPLGRLGENEHTQIEFNVEQWQTEYPGCHFTLQNRRPEDETAYPVADVTLDGSTLIWTVASSALTQTGRGECELCVMLGDVVAKSVIYATIIGRALDGSGDVPDEWENWQTVFMSIKDDAETAADNAEEAETGGECRASGNRRLGS